MNEVLQKMRENLDESEYSFFDVFKNMSVESVSNKNEYNKIKPLFEKLPVRFRHILKEDHIEKYIKIDKHYEIYKPIIYTNETKNLDITEISKKFNNSGSGKLGKASVFTISNKTKLLFKRIKIERIEYKIEDNIKINTELKALFFNFLLQLHLFGTESFNNICKIYEFGYIEKTQIQFKHTNKNTKNKPQYLEPELYCIMEYGGEPLDKYIKKNTMDINSVNKIILQCAKCVKIIHDLNYVHFDISLDNFLIINDGTNITIKIIDYGELSVSDDNVKSIKGNPLYISPIFLTANSKYYIANKSFDIFSLGCVYMYLLHSITNKDINNIYILPYKYPNPISPVETLYNFRKLYDTKTYIDIGDEIIPIDSINKILQPFLNLNNQSNINISYSNIIDLQNFLSKLSKNEAFKTKLIDEIDQINIENISQIFIDKISQIFIDKISEEIKQMNSNKSTIKYSKEYFKDFIIKFFSFVTNIKDYLSIEKKQTLQPLYKYEINKLTSQLYKNNLLHNYDSLNTILIQMIESHDNINDIIKSIPIIDKIIRNRNSNIDKNIRNRNSNIVNN